MLYIEIYDIYLIFDIVHLSYILDNLFNRNIIKSLMIFKLYVIVEDKNDKIHTYSKLIKLKSITII